MSDVPCQIVCSNYLYHCLQTLIVSCKMCLIFSEQRYYYLYYLSLCCLFFLQYSGDTSFLYCLSCMYIVHDTLRLVGNIFFNIITCKLILHAFFLVALVHCTCYKIVHTNSNVKLFYASRLQSPYCSLLCTLCVVISSTFNNAHFERLYLQMIGLVLIRNPDPKT